MSQRDSSSTRSSVNMISLATSVQAAWCRKTACSILLLLLCYHHCLHIEAKAAATETSSSSSRILEKVRAGNARIVMAAVLRHREHPSSPFRSPEGTTPEEFASGRLERSARHRYFVNAEENAAAAGRRRLNNGTATEFGDELPVAQGDSFSGHIVPGQEKEYYVEVSVGDPAVRVGLQIDTGSGLTWVQCGSNVLGRSTRSPYADYIPANSGPYTPLLCPSFECSSHPLFRTCNALNQCTYSYAYTQQHHRPERNTRGHLATETFEFAEGVLQPIQFACASLTPGFEDSVGRGVLGLGPAPYSVPSQMLSNVFFCLPQRHPDHGVVGIGDLDHIPLPTTRHTMLVPNPHDLHMVRVVGFTIERTHYALTFDAFNAALSTGAIVSYLPPPTLYAMRAAFTGAAHVRGLTEEPAPTEAGLNLTPCFKLGQEGPTVANTPSVKLHFQGNLTITLPPENIFFPSRTTPGVYCLAFDASPNDNRGTLGTTTLSSFLVTIDNTQTMRVGFTPDYC